MNDIKVIFIAILFVALGIFMLNDPDAPAWVAWINIIFFGGGGIVFLLIKIYQIVSGKKENWEGKPEDSIQLKNGADYEISLTSDEIIITNLITKEFKKLPWSGLTEVYAVAIDAIPTGGISWIFHCDTKVVEIPWEARNGNVLLAEMQTRLSGFDNEAVIEMSVTLHGLKKIWSKT